MNEKSLSNRILGYSFLASVVINMGWIAWVGHSDIFRSAATMTNLHPQQFRIYKPIPVPPRPQPAMPLPPPPPPPKPRVQPRIKPLKPILPIVHHSRPVPRPHPITPRPVTPPPVTPRPRPLPPPPVPQKPVVKPKPTVKQNPAPPKVQTRVEPRKPPPINKPLLIKKVPITATGKQPLLPDPGKQAEAARQEAARQEASRQEAAAKQEAARLEAARLESARQEAARQETARQEAAKQESARQEAAKREAAKREQAASRESSKQEEAAKQEAAKKEAERRKQEHRPGYMKVDEQDASPMGDYDSPQVPEEDAEGISGKTVTVAWSVDERGRPVNVRVKRRSGNAEVDRICEDIIRHMKFRPAVQDHYFQEAQMSHDFSF